MEMTIKELAAEMIKDTKNVLHEVKELDLKSIKGLFTLVVLVVRFVEKLAKDGDIVKEDKKELAIEIIDQLVPDIPYIPNVLERPTLRWLVGLLIDQLVEGFNRVFGKLWIEKLN